MQEGIYQGFEKQLVGANRHLVFFEGGPVSQKHQAMVDHCKSQSFKGCEIVGKVRSSTMANTSGTAEEERTATNSNGGDHVDDGVLCKIQLRSSDVEWAVVRPSVLPSSSFTSNHTSGYDRQDSADR